MIFLCNYPNKIINRNFHSLFEKKCFSLGLKFLNIICKNKWYFLFTFYANIFQDLNMA